MVMKKKKTIKRKVSRITVPKDNSGAKDKMKAFRCSKELAKLLDLEENQSETIQKALLEYLGKGWIDCPTCKGSGEIRAHKKH